MTTITINIDEATLAMAQKKAAEMATSIDAVVADYLRHWAEDEKVEQARAAMVARFSNPDWQFAVGAPDTREQRNARA